MRKTIVLATVVLVTLSVWAPAWAGVIQPSRLVYQGAFKVPSGTYGTLGLNNWAYGGSGWAFNPSGNGGAGSLFGINRGVIGEMSLAAPVISPTKNLNDLNSATQLQNFCQAGIDSNVKGVAYLPAQGPQTAPKLYTTANEGNSNVKPICWQETTLSSPSIQGPWAPAGVDWRRLYNFLSPFPQVWANAYTGGRSLVVGGGLESYLGGPMLVAMGPWLDGNPPMPDTTISYKTLLAYDSSHPISGYSVNDGWNGGAFLTWGTKDSAFVLFGSKNVGASTMHAYALFYNTADLAAVAAGIMQPYAPQPAATLDLDSYMWGAHSLYGATYDSAHRLLYVCEIGAYNGGASPLIHVFYVADPSTPDTIPPAAISNLSAAKVTSTTATLTWTAPGNDGMVDQATGYDLRYSTSQVVTDANFAAATPMAGLPTPQLPGTTETFRVTGLLANTPYWFAIKTRDEAPNWSTLSNVLAITTTAPDITPPTTITDLSVSSIGITNLTVSWTTPTDTQSGMGGYDLRYSTSQISSGADFAAATPAVGLPAPATSGTSVQFTVNGLTSPTTYYFAIKSYDNEFPANVSAMSNVAVGTTMKADVLGMPFGQKSLEFVNVADPGNTADTTGNGAVSYAYQVGKYHVTSAQYTQFLNAVAKNDPYGLWNSTMDGSSSAAGQAGITRSGGSSSYTYSVAAGKENYPVSGATWGDAIRFINWLNNGQPLGVLTGNPTLDARLTEDGAYAINGAITETALNNPSIVRKSGSGVRFVLPSLDEWYKAAYYKGGSKTAGYWRYGNKSDTMPSNTLSTTGSNNANYNYSDPVKGTTPVGFFAGSVGPCGTYDTNGNLWQWNEQLYPGSGRGLRGSAWYIGTVDPSSASGGWHPDSYHSDLGFRVVRLRGDAFNMSSGQKSLEFVTVGDRGNAANPANPGRGAVAYTYEMSKYDITAAQYCLFLNSVAWNDVYGLYNSNMWGINIGGTAGARTYSVVTGMDNYPAGAIRWGDAIRFSNWLNNGQKMGVLTGNPAQDAWLTEDGAYAINGAVTDAALVSPTVVRKSTAIYALTNEEEWYKATYYKGGSTNAGYWMYPCRSDQIPSNNVLDLLGTNNTNYNTGTYGNPTNPALQVGYWVNSPNPCGAYDLNGNAYLQMEDLISGWRGLQGTGNNTTADRGTMAATCARGSDSQGPTYVYGAYGFRVVQLPYTPPTTPTVAFVLGDN